MPQTPTAVKTSNGNLIKWLVRSLLVVVVAVLLISTFAYVKLQGSLPRLDGQLKIAGVADTVTIERDEMGVATITGNNRRDIAFATGFLHAQERFFQMDLMRRQGAGELSELFGPKALKIDKKSRIHRFRHRAEKYVAALNGKQRALLKAYIRGINSGIAQLSSPPFEYILLQQEPAAWKMEDTYLCVFAMYILLQETDGRPESNLALMRDHLPASLVNFLVPIGTRWDAAIDNKNYPKPALPERKNYFSNYKRTLEATAAAPESDHGFLFDIPDEMRAAIGSNNWVVAGKLTKHGGAILANDMHLPISIPNTWYRASFIMKDSSANENRITGVTLPGSPITIAGSTAKVAWGYTNAYGDWSDLILLEIDPDNENRYRTPDGWQDLQKTTETIRINGAEDFAFEFEETIWGPVIDQDHLGRKRAYRWVAHLDRAVNLNLIEMETAPNVHEAIRIAHTIGIPAQNFVVGDKDGNIAWTIGGAIPKRVGLSGHEPQSWAQGDKYWDGWLDSSAYPKVVNPESGRIWSANSRVVGGEMYEQIYDGSFAAGARAQQIRDDLFAKDEFVETDMLEIQRDNRATFLARWQKFLLKLLDDASLSEKPARAEFRQLIEKWEGRAVITSVSYRLVKAYRSGLAKSIFAGLLDKLKDADPRFRYMFSTTHQYEQPLWDMVTRQPDYMLLPEYASWQELLLSHVDKVIAEVGEPLADRTWGEQNTVAVQHPFSTVMPFLEKWLDIPAQPLNGDRDMPFVQTPWKGKSFGASERFAVSPGREDQAYFHMPTGQSAHPLSPFYNKGHQAWVHGDATPFLPQKALYRLVLAPQAEKEKMTAN